MENIENIKLRENSTIKEALQIINQGAIQIALVVDDKDRLLGTLTDGDIRRGLLKNYTLNDSINDLYFKKPITSLNSESKEKIIQKAIKNQIYQIPIVDENNILVDIVNLATLLKTTNKRNRVILMAGGLGTRLRPLTEDTPKPMLKVGNKPILETIIKNFASHGFVNITISLNYKGNIIKDYFKDGSQFGVSITYYCEEYPMGTAGAISQIAHLLDSDFYVFYGDTIMDIDLNKMLEFHREKKSEATLLVHPNDHPYDSDIVELNDENRLIKLHLKPHPADFVSRNLVNASLFILSPKVIEYIPFGKKLNFEKHIFPICIENNLKIFGYVSSEYIKDMGTPDRYEKVCQDVKSGKVHRLNRKYSRVAVFLDRDGVINKDVHFLHDPKQLELISGAAKAIHLINQKGYLAVVVTNQPVIARNMCSISDLNYIHETLETMLGKEHAYLNAIYYCPHHPDKGYPEERKEYKIICNCRKPKPGMLFQAAKDLNIDLERSFLVGDSLTDIDAGKNAGITQLYQLEQNKDFALFDLVNKIL